MSFWTFNIIFNDFFLNAPFSLGITDVNQLVKLPLAGSSTRHFKIFQKITIPTKKKKKLQKIICYGGKWIKISELVDQNVKTLNQSVKLHTFKKLCWIMWSKTDVPDKLSKTQIPDKATGPGQVSKLQFRPWKKNPIKLFQSF